MGPVRYFSVYGSITEARSSYWVSQFYPRRLHVQLGIEDSQRVGMKLLLQIAAKAPRQVVLEDGLYTLVLCTC